MRSAMTMRENFSNRARKLAFVQNQIACESLERRTLLAGVTVNTTADQIDPAGSTTVSLRDALNMAAADQVDSNFAITFDSKVFATAQTINLSKGTLSLVVQSAPSSIETLQITGPAVGVTINGQNKSGVLDLEGLISVSLSNLKITNSTTDGIHLLAPISGSENYTLTNVTVTGSKGAGAWAMDNGDENTSIDATDCSFNNNTGDGIDAPFCSVQDSTLSGDAWGINLGSGGPQGYGSVADLTGVTISGNKLGGVTADVVNATNTTISGNKGFGIQFNNFVARDNSPAIADGVLTNVTIAANAGGIDATKIPAMSEFEDANGPFVSIGNSIVAGNTTASISADVSGPIVSLGHNLIGIHNGTNALSGVGGWLPSDLLGTAATPQNPQLSALGNFGGPTLTQLPAPSSPVVDAGSNALIPSGITTDQRSNPRIFGATVDIGAVEVRYCTVAGLVFNDTNQNGVQDAGEHGIAGITVYSDANNNGKLDPGELKTVTIASGAYTLTDLAAGSYKIRQVLPAGATQTTPANNFGFTVTLGTGQTITGDNFGQHQTVVAGASISGTVFNDSNGNGIQDSNEAGLPGITVYNDANNNNKLDSGELSTVTVSGGNYSFASLSPGNYKIREILPSGSKQTTPTNNFGWTITLSANQTLTGKNFGEQATNPPPPTGATISGIVFNDANGNGRDDSGEAGVSDWTIYIDSNNDGILDGAEVSMHTASDGSFSFTDLAAGTYILRVIRPSGWSQTAPSNGLGQHITVTTNQAKTGVLFGEEKTA